MSLWHIQEIGQLPKSQGRCSTQQQSRPGDDRGHQNEERTPVARELGTISITKVKNRGIRKPRAKKKNVTEHVGTEDGDNPKLPTKKRTKRDHEKGIQPRLYNPLTGEVPAKEFGLKLLENLKSINSDALICKILGSDINWDDTVETKYGKFPKTSTLAIQQKLAPDPTSAAVESIAPTSPSPPPPPGPIGQVTPCNLTTTNISTNNINEYSYSLRTSHIAIANEQPDLYTHLHTRTAIQEHGCDFRTQPLWH